MKVFNAAVSGESSVWPLTDCLWPLFSRLCSSSKYQPDTQAAYNFNLLCKMMHYAPLSSSGRECLRQACSTGCQR